MNDNDLTNSDKLKNQSSVELKYIEIVMNDVINMVDIEAEWRQRTQLAADLLLEEETPGFEEKVSILVSSNTNIVSITEI